jgi:hypothetical protein
MSQFLALLFVLATLAFSSKAFASGQEEAMLNNQAVIAMSEKKWQVAFDKLEKALKINVPLCHGESCNRPFSIRASVEEREETGRSTKAIPRSCILRAQVQAKSRAWSIHRAIDD